MLHALAILYARWKIPEGAKAHLSEMEEALSGNVVNDFKWIEGALKAQREQGREYLVGEGLSVADVMMQFSVEFILERGLGVKKGSWPETEAWLERTMVRDGFKIAVDKSGYTLDSKGQFRT